jgi:hypothetical protein
MILLPLTLAAVTAGCSTFSDSDVVARVNDVELTGDEFDAKLTELGVTGAEVVPLEPVRAELTRWIQQQLVPADEIAAIYDAGAAEAGVVCVGAIVVADQETADAALDDIESGTDFVEVFQRDNLDQGLVQTNGAIPCVSAADLEGNAGTPFIDVAAALSADNPTGSAPILDDTGAETAWVVLVFRSFDELDSVDVEQVTSLIDVSQFAADADVYVDSRYGTFDAATGTVVSLS